MDVESIFVVVRLDLFAFNEHSKTAAQIQTGEVRARYFELIEKEN